MGTEISGNILIKYDGAGTDFVLPAGVTGIGDLAFSGAGELRSVDISACSGSIGNYAFMNCYSLRRVRMPERVSSIGAGLFQNCWKLESVRLPEGMVNIGSDMFDSCHELKTVYLPDSLEQVERAAFNACRALRRLYISPDRIGILPASLRNIAVLTYMSDQADAEGNTWIDGYASARQRLLLDLAINRKDTDAVKYMLDHAIADEDTLQACLQKASSAGRVEITALLLDRNRAKKTDPVLAEDPFA